MILKALGIYELCLLRMNDIVRIFEDEKRGNNIPTSWATVYIIFNINGRVQSICLLHVPHVIKETTNKQRRRGNNKGNKDLIQ